MLKLWQKVYRHLDGLFRDEDSQKRVFPGRVIYIHPEGRFHTVEFEFSGGKIRQSFSGVGR